jgi:hypothetical protein
MQDRPVLLFGGRIELERLSGTGEGLFQLVESLECFLVSPLQILATPEFPLALLGRKGKRFRLGIVRFVGKRGEILSVAHAVSAFLGEWDHSQIRVARPESSKGVAD